MAKETDVESESTGLHRPWPPRPVQNWLRRSQIRSVWKWCYGRLGGDSKRVLWTNDPICVHGEDDEADEDDEEVLGSMDSATDDDEEAMEHPHKKQKLWYCDLYKN